MRPFVQTLLLWAIVALFLVVGFTAWHAAIGRVPPWIENWAPYILIVFAYMVLITNLQRNRMRQLIARSEEVAETAHVDAERIIALLNQIKDQRRPPPAQVPPDPAGI